MEFYKINDYNRHAFISIDKRFLNFTQVMRCVELSDDLEKNIDIVSSIFLIFKFMLTCYNSDKCINNSNPYHQEMIVKLECFFTEYKYLFDRTLRGHYAKNVSFTLPITKRKIRLRTYNNNFINNEFHVFDYSGDIIDFDKNIKNLIEEYNKLWERIDKHIKEKGSNKSVDGIRCKQHHFLDKQKEFDNLEKEFLGIGILTLIEVYKNTEDYKYLSFLLELAYHYFADFYRVHTKEKTIKYHSNKLKEMMSNPDKERFVNIKNYDFIIKNYKESKYFMMILPWSRERFSIRKNTTLKNYDYDRDFYPEVLLEELAEEIGQMRYIS